MEDIFQRTQMLLGSEAMRRLASARVAVFGLGGVGSYVTEALARSGVGALTLVDRDIVDKTNINRQLIATHSTIGKAKAAVAAARVADINPDCEVDARQIFFLSETAAQFDFSEYDYVADAVDNVTAKLQLAECAQAAGVPIISAMGAGNKLRPELLEVADIFSTSVCPLARVMRRELKKRGIAALKVVYSREEPMTPEGGGRTPGSVAFVPSVAGLLMAGEIIRDIAKY